MKYTYLVALLISGVILGCGKKEDDLAVAAPTPTASAPDLGATPPPTTTPASTPPPAVTPLAPAVDVDAGGEMRMANGDMAKDTLDYLNNLVWNLNEARATWSTDATPSFKSEAEKLAYDEAIKKRKEPITDIEELVKAQKLKKIPAAPAGKKFVINPTTHKVELANQ